MLFHSVLIVIFALPALISSTQFPIVNQVVGGVPHPDQCNFKTPEGASSNNAPAPTPEKLRVVENSGVCGGSFLYDSSRVQSIDRFGRNYEGCLSGFWIW